MPRDLLRSLALALLHLLVKLGQELGKVFLVGPHDDQRDGLVVGQGGVLRPVQPVVDGAGNAVVVEAPAHVQLVQGHNLSGQDADAVAQLLR